jgi:hypothetical protein
MNPFLEQEDTWHDFHQRFIAAAAESLGPQVLPKYFVKIDSNAYIHELPASDRRPLGRPDVAVISNEEPSTARHPAAMQAPVNGRLPVAVDIERQSFLEIRDRETRQVVTVVELLSPSNKASDREQYLGKREEALRSKANFVEIDLLRGGARLPVDGLPECDYYVMVSRADERPNVGLWPIRLRETLPVIPVPLRPGDAEAKLELQQLLNRVFATAGYQFYIYRSSPQPSLSPPDAEWARQFLPTGAKAEV